MEFHYTFLHLSDLHIGDIYPKTKLSHCDSNALKKAKYVPHHPGNLGHDTIALRAINKLYRKLKNAPGPGGFSVIVTGDITAFGKQEHFQTANDFLFGPFTMGPRHDIGLNLADRRGMIPGNHDYFAGTPFPFGRRTGHFDKFFARPPIKYPYPNFDRTLPLPDGRLLRFLEIDCDHDFEIGNRKPRFLARESGVNHLRQLSKTLGPPGNEVRILLMHGSVRYQDGLFRVCELMEDARAELDKFCAAHNVKAILCGHVHQSSFGSLFWWNNAPITELCCGTSSQLVRSNAVGQVSGKLLGILPRTNQVLVHRIWSDSGPLHWSTWEHVLRSGDTEFQEPAGGYTFPL